MEGTIIRDVGRGEGLAESQPASVEVVPRRWRLRPRAVVGIGIGVLLFAGLTLGVLEDVGTHQALGSSRSDLATSRRSLAAASAEAGQLHAELSAAASANTSLSARQEALASANASMGAALSAEASAQAAQASSPIFEQSGSGGISPDASLGFVVAKAGPYVVLYSFSGCSNDSPLMFVVQNAETSEDLDVAPNASGKLTGATAVFLAAGNWELFGGGQLVSNGNYDPQCKWKIAIAPNS